MLLNNPHVVLNKSCGKIIAYKRTLGGPGGQESEQGAFTTAGRLHKNDGSGISKFLGGTFDSDGCAM